MALPLDFAIVNEAACEVTEFESDNVITLKALEPNAIGSYEFGNPGFHTEGARRVGIGGVLIDYADNLNDAKEHFARPQFSRPKVTIKHGDAVTTILRDEAVAEHFEDGSAVLAFSFGTPPCTRKTTLKHLLNLAKIQHKVQRPLADPEENLVQFVVTRYKEFLEKGIVFAAETVLGAAPSQDDLKKLSCLVQGAGITCTIMKELEFGARVHGAHIIFFPCNFPITTTATMRARGRELAQRTCLGGNSALPPVGADKVPLKVECCEGQVIARWNSSIKRITIKNLARYMDADPRHATTVQHINNALLPIMSSFITSLLCSHRNTIRSGYPRIGYEAASRDPQLAAWRASLHMHARNTRRPITPITSAYLLYAPETLPGFVVVEDVTPYQLISTQIPQDGVDITENIASAFARVCPLVANRSDFFSFHGAREHSGSVVFSTSYASDGVVSLFASSLSAFRETGGGDKEAETFTLGDTKFIALPLEKFALLQDGTTPLSQLTVHALMGRCRDALSEEAQDHLAAVHNSMAQSDIVAATLPPAPRLGRLPTEKFPRTTRDRGKFGFSAHPGQRGGARTRTHADQSKSDEHVCVSHTHIDPDIQLAPPILSSEVMSADNSSELERYYMEYKALFGKEAADKLSLTKRSIPGSYFDKGSSTVRTSDRVIVSPTQFNAVGVIMYHRGCIIAPADERGRLYTFMAVPHILVCEEHGPPSAEQERRYPTWAGTQSTLVNHVSTWFGGRKCEQQVRSLIGDAMHDTESVTYRMYQRTSGAFSRHTSSRIGRRCYTVRLWLLQIPDDVDLDAVGHVDGSPSLTSKPVAPILSCISGLPKVPHHRTLRVPADGTSGSHIRETPQAKHRSPYQEPLQCDPHAH